MSEAMPKIAKNHRTHMSEAMKVDWSPFESIGAYVPLSSAVVLSNHELAMIAQTKLHTTTRIVQDS